MPASRGSQCAPVARARAAAGRRRIAPGDPERGRGSPQRRREPFAARRRPSGMGLGSRISCAVLTRAVLTGAGLAAALAGCGTGGGTQPAVPAVAITKGVAVTEPAADPRPLGAADSAFGLDVLHAWCAQHP